MLGTELFEGSQYSIQRLTSGQPADIATVHSLLPQNPGLSADEQTKKVINSFIAKINADGHRVVVFTPGIDFSECERIYGTILGYEYKQMILLVFRLRPFMDIFNYFFNTKRFHQGMFKESFEKGLLVNKRIYE